MSLLVGFSGIQPDDLQPDRRVDVPCQVAARVTKVWEVEEGDATNFLLVVLAATDATQVGRVHVETLRHSGTTAEKDRHVRRRLLRFGKAFGLVTDEQIESGQPVTLDLDAAIGREAVFGMIRRRFRDDDGNPGSAIQVGFLDAWHVDDPEGPDRCDWHTAQPAEVAD